jgi:aspartate racemase
MKVIGLLGGMSDRATAEYYRMINAGVNRRLGGWDIAEIVIQSVNFGNIEHFVRHEKWQEAGDYLAAKAVGAERAGADMLLCASNTLHRVVDRITGGISIPFIHIADPTGRAIRAAGLTRVALLGTKPTMAADFFKKHYGAHHGVEILVPEEEEQRRVDRIIFDELVRNVMTEESKRYYLEVCRRLQAAGAQGVILGCTEIFLLIDQDNLPGLPVFDTTALHVEAAVEFALANVSE